MKKILSILILLALFFFINSEYQIYYLFFLISLLYLVNYVSREDFKKDLIAKTTRYRFNKVSTSFLPNYNKLLELDFCKYELNNILANWNNNDGLEKRYCLKDENTKLLLWFQLQYVWDLWIIKKFYNWDEEVSIDTIVIDKSHDQFDYHIPILKWQESLYYYININPLWQLKILFWRTSWLERIKRISNLDLKELNNNKIDNIYNVLNFNLINLEDLDEDFFKDKSYIRKINKLRKKYIDKVTNSSLINKLNNLNIENIWDELELVYSNEHILSLQNSYFDISYKELNE